MQLQPSGSAVDRCEAHVPSVSGGVGKSVNRKRQRVPHATSVGPEAVGSFGEAGAGETPPHALHVDRRLGQQVPSNEAEDEVFYSGLHCASKVKACVCNEQYAMEFRLNFDHTLAHAPAVSWM